VKYLLIILLLISCKKEKIESTYTTFYINQNLLRDRLYVDGEFKGILTPINVIPICGDNIKDRVITIYLREGSHTYSIEKDSILKNVRKFTTEGKCKTILAR